MSPVPRAFLALMLGERLGRRLAESVRRALAEGPSRPERRFRLPRPEGLHLTLYFLGPVPEEALDALWEPVRARAERIPAPHLRLDRAGAFPERGQARVLWIGVTELPPGGIGVREPAEQAPDRPPGEPGARAAGSLAALQRAVLEGLEEAGVDTRAEREREFRPHVTVARPRAGSAPVPEAFGRLAPDLEWRPSSLALVHSRLGSGPARYEPIRTIPLGV